MTRNKLLDVMRRTGDPRRIAINRYRNTLLEELPSELLRRLNLTNISKVCRSGSAFSCKRFVSGRALLRDTAAKLMMTENAVRVALHSGCRILSPTRATPEQMFQNADWSDVYDLHILGTDVALT